MDKPIERAEHEEFVKRMEEEHRRLGKRIGKLENQSEDIGKLSISVSELATSVKLMADEQRRHSDKLEVLENRDGEMYRKIIGYVITAIVGIVIGFIFTQIGM